ncbi:tyrosine-type recombinase/integrase [Haloarcula laminariae]|uniref:tyrosine-type recombinase/integrase n=1 Tax=Haloarcula laminariae TaxID=2961577 RepID=UPI002404BFF5|nr:tyrosine-type recombinase/integrase [Halomicroarcula sp. FL173]
MTQTPAFDLEEALAAFEDHIRFGVSDNQQVAESTAQGYNSDVRRFAQYLEEHRPYTEGILDVSTSDLRQFLKHRRKEGDKPRTIVGRRSALSRFYAVLPKLAEDQVIALDHENVPESPEDGLEGAESVWSVPESHKSQKQGGPSYLQAEDIPRLYRNVPAPVKRNRLILKLLYQSGMRRNECATIRLDDIEPVENQEITIRAENSKSGKQRTVYYKESLIPTLREWIDGGYRSSEGKAEQSEYLLPTRESVHIHPDHITQIVKQAAEDAGLQAHVYTDSGGKRRDKVTPHTLRHSYAVNMLRPPNPVDVRTLQKLLGHSDLSVTEQYLDLVREDEKDEYLRSGGPPESSIDGEIT